MTDSEDWELHRAEVESRLEKKRLACVERAVKRHKRSKQGMKEERALKFERLMKRHRFENADLWRYLGRQGWRGKTPEARSAQARHAQAVAAIKRKLCQHTKLPPKKRIKGKNAGLWVCPSCQTPVPAPRGER